MQPELPNLPPMQPVSQPTPSQTPPTSSAVKPIPVSGGKRLRQMMAALAGGGLGLIALVGVSQLALRDELKPTTLLATLEGQTELGILNQKLGVEAGKMIFTEYEYRAKIAEAERAGQTRAELAYQKDLAVVQADKERVVGAYQTLYQRTNIIAQAGVQMESVAMQFRQRLLEQTNGGRAVVISVYDMMCALGQQDACEAARQARQGMVGEATSLTEGDLARKINELMAGITDPASLIAGQDIKQRGAPSLER